jgi:uncharacterized protein involved in exopolysaccharide biosynthesis
MFFKQPSRPCWYIDHPKFEGCNVNDWGERNRAPRSTVKADLMVLVASAWRRKWWLAGCVIGFGGTFAIVALRMPHVYRASTELVPAPTSGLSGGSGGAGTLGSLASLAGIEIGGGAGKTDEVLAVLTSRQFIEQFIRDKQLLPILYADIWDKKTGTWKAGIQPPPLVWAYKSFKSNILSVGKEKDSGIIKLNVDWTDGELAAAWANELVDRINSEMRARAMDEADRSVHFLEEESRRTSLVPTQQAIGRLMESQINQRMLANVTSEYALRVVDRALPPDPKEPYAPRRTLIAAAGVVIGLTVGFFLVWFFAEPLEMPRWPPSTPRSDRGD